MSEYNIVSVSGGKDSTALLLLAIERQPDNLQAVFDDTGHEHQQTYDYVRYLEQATGVPIRWIKADFTEDIERKRCYIAEKWPGKGVPPDAVDRALEALKPTGNPFLDLCMMKGRFPSTKARFCSKRGSATFFAASDLGVMFNDHRAYEYANINRFVEWAKTSRGGKQIDWLRSDTDNVPLCTSIYGLCE